MPNVELTKDQKLTPKQAVLRALGPLYIGRLSVTRGRGTAGNWISIKTEYTLAKDTRQEVEAALIRAQFCGSYWPDDGFTQNSVPCVSWGLL